MLVEKYKEMFITVVQRYRGRDADSDHIKMTQEIPRERKRRYQHKSTQLRLKKEKERMGYNTHMNEECELLAIKEEMGKIWTAIYKYTLNS